MHACMSVCIGVCMYVCVHVRMHACMDMYVCMHACTYSVPATLIPNPSPQMPTHENTMPLNSWPTQL